MYIPGDEPFGQHYADYNVIIIAVTITFVAFITCCLTFAWRMTKNDNARILFRVSDRMRNSLFFALFASILLTSLLAYYFTIYLRIGNMVYADTGDGCIIGSLIAMNMGIIYTSFIFTGMAAFAQLPELRNKDYAMLKARRNRVKQAAEQEASGQPETRE